MVILAWLVIISFLMFGAFPVIAFLCSRDPFITYQEAVGLGFAIAFGLTAFVGLVGVLWWACKVVFS